jgi:hypothetical protein
MSNRVPGEPPITADRSRPRRRTEVRCRSGTDKARRKYDAPGGISNENANLPDGSDRRRNPVRQRPLHGEPPGAGRSRREPGEPQRKRGNRSLSSGERPRSGRSKSASAAYPPPHSKQSSSKERVPPSTAAMRNPLPLPHDLETPVHRFSHRRRGANGRRTDGRHPRTLRLLFRRLDLLRDHAIVHAINHAIVEIGPTRPGPLRFDSARGFHGDLTR